jgi:hypothetical protein
MAADSGEPMGINHFGRVDVGAWLGLLARLAYRAADVSAAAGRKDVGDVEQYRPAIDVITEYVR